MKNKNLTHKQYQFLYLREGLTIAMKNVLDTNGMAGFIMCFCSIDWMAQYYFGRDTKADDYKEFVKRFLPKDYDAEEMYADLRCGLVHNYTNKGCRQKYDLREDRASSHLQLGRVRGNPHVQLKVLNLSNFKEDLRSALAKLFDILEKNPEMKTRAVLRYRNVGIFYGHIETE